MIHILLTGAIAAQATPTPAASTIRGASPKCRAPDGRYIMSCFPKGVVKPMTPRTSLHGGRLLVELPDAKAAPKKE